MKNTTYIVPSLLGASPSPLRSRAWALVLTAAAILPLLLSTASSSFAGSATWLASPADGYWSNAANWSAGGPPNGPMDTATFATSNITGVSTGNTEVNGIVFNAGASAFTISVNPGYGVNSTMTISGVGITNNSAIAQNFVTGANYIPPYASRGIITFINSATAGNGTFTNGGGLRSLGGSTQFFASSTAGAATLIATVGLIAGGSIEFLE